MHPNREILARYIADAQTYFAAHKTFTRFSFDTSPPPTPSTLTRIALTHQFPCTIIRHLGITPNGEVDPAWYFIGFSPPWINHRHPSILRCTRPLPPQAWPELARVRYSQPILDVSQLAAFDSTRISSHFIYHQLEIVRHGQQPPRRDDNDPGSGGSGNRWSDLLIPLRGRQLSPVPIPKDQPNSPSNHFF